jgi:hypothetical protein
VTAPAADPVDPVMHTITRTWTATDECSLNSECVQTISVLRQARSLIVVDALLLDALPDGAIVVLVLIGERTDGPELHAIETIADVAGRCAPDQRYG